MNQNVNLTKRIKQQLPPELVEFIQLAGQTAVSMETHLYLAGGIVRDLLLQRSNLDIDLVVEGDAIKIAGELARLKKGRLIAHSRFNTAKIQWDKWSVDIAAARGETYERPGALPTVQPWDLPSDLIRRDFSINAMAVSLAPSNYGELIDLHHGQEDLEHRFIRILHGKSFQDDATRIWRAVRYEQRLDFRIEPHTLDLLERDIICLDTISGDRLRHEIELCLEEERPEKALLRAGELGILSRILPSLKINRAAAGKMSRARGVLQPYTPPREIYLALLFYALNQEDLKQVVLRLNFPKAVTWDLDDTLRLRDELPSLAAVETPLSQVYHCLHPYSQNAILANWLATDLPSVQQKIDAYLNHLRHVQPALTGEDLIQMGILSGPRVKEVLELLREARLDGKVSSLEEEIEMAKKIGSVL
jgi:tRNA nucleotidyltransferase (CCA-adding enzyme)